MGGHRHMPSVDDQLNELTKALNLTDAQKPQVKTILQDQRDQMKQVMENSSGSREENMSKMRQIHESATGKIRDLLADEQKTKYDKLQEERKKDMQERRGNWGGEKPNGPPEQN